MASKETRPKRHKALEAPREPRRPKTHWDHVLEEMAWLSKDFEAERKWKLSQAKKVALKASKGMLDQATRGEKRLKEEEHRLRKVALNISKDVKKFWLKIEKLVLYKHQLELEAKKQKARDKQLEFLLGQTERYSNMLAENLVNTNQPAQICVQQAQESCPGEETNDSCLKETRDLNIEPLSNKLDNDEDFNILSEDDPEDDEHTLEEDEALITEKERQVELEALRDEMDLPLEELLKRYAAEEARRGSSPINSENSVRAIELEEKHQNGGGDYPCSSSKSDPGSSPSLSGRRCGERDGVASAAKNHISDVEMSEAAHMSEYFGYQDDEELVYDFSGDEQEDGEFFLGNGEEKDDEATMEEEEELAKKDSSGPVDEIATLQKESEIPIEELLARYKKDLVQEYSEDESENVSASLGDMVCSPTSGSTGVKKQVDDMDEGVQLTKHEPAVNSNSEGLEAVIIDKPDEIREGENRIADAAAAARSAQPTGITFSTTKVRTKFPFLLKYPLREYQHIGLDWLVTMYEKRLNGILADEMGLGKTIMTISLLAHLACEKGIWGPHLIVVPTSVMLNWETEFLKWCPAFKILTYFGTAKERKLKRQGWLKPNSFHVCITTYRLVIQDSKVFKRKKWKYLILDEAHLIKNWKSQRWQTLLNFNSKRRILLTGTPLQNDLMELWSLMHFLMPHIFQSHQEFKEWFSNPIAEMVEGQEKVNREVIDRLHNVLRPFILRRLKRDVEKQLPMKQEHVIYCRLSKRQRNLYEDFISSSETQATLASSNFFGMISVIMQLRKVCNHPDLFEGRPIISSYDMHGIDIQLSSSVCSILSAGPFSTVDLRGLGYIFTHLDLSMCSWESDEVEAIATPSCVIMERPSSHVLGPRSKQQSVRGTSIFEEIRKAVMDERFKEAKEHAASIAWWNSLRCRRKPIYPTTLRELVTLTHPVDDIFKQKTDRISYLYSSKLADIVLAPLEWFQRMIEVIESFMFVIPPARAPSPVCWCSKSGATSVFLPIAYREKCTEVLLPLLSTVRPAIVRRQVYFPDRRLIQFDCGKLQELALLLRKLKSQGHRALIFTQMTKMLDILEAFINLYGYTYMRLDGSTQPEERQTLMQRFNTNPKIFLFILSTRSGGVGINLVGADTVIFYDSDWNPAMDQQAQDRCHRIGQTREVHIYRLVSEKTIEENILKKANQKRALDDLVIQGGSYNTEFLKKLDPMELFSDHRALTVKSMQRGKKLNTVTEVSVSNADVEAALKQAEDEADYMALKKVEEEEAVDNQEFTEEASGRFDDDELANEEDMKGDEPADQSGWISNPNKSGGLTSDGTNHKAERSLTLAGRDDDIDLLADVKQMAAAAAAAGQEISSFEDQLRPLDRYAMRFLELWDPIIDKAAIYSDVKFEEKEWELDRIEKYKEEMEAEMDEDEEPLVYERWDADFATEAYRQQVEVLTQHQLMEDLEYEAKLKEAAAEENNTQGNTMPSNRKPKPKSKKKAKKTKFKSLKKRTLASKAMPVKEEPSLETLSIDDDSMDDLTSSEVSDFDVESTQTAALRKRKKSEYSRDLEEVKHLNKKSKKTKKPSAEIYYQEKVSDLTGGQHDESLEVRSCDNIFMDIEAKTPSRSRAGGKISIIPMPIKRILMIKPEKTKKGNILSRDCVPSPDNWASQEDAVLCAAVHEYGPNWGLVSDVLYGMTAGGLYRGRYRHPVHCCERFRELVQRYILYPTENLNTEKVSTSGKALLKVTEEHIQMLLDFASKMADDELLLQNHFTALISSAWRTSTLTDNRHTSASLPNGLCTKERYSGLTFSREATRKKLTNFSHCSKLVRAALCDAGNNHQGGNVSPSNLEEKMSPIVESMEISLEFQRDKGDMFDTVATFPSFVNLTILGSDPAPPVSRAAAADNHLKSISSMAEHRFWESAKTCTEDSERWASSAFPTTDIKNRSSSKLQTLCKHKLSNSDSMKPSKSNSSRTTMEHCGSCPPVSELIHQLNQVVLANDQHFGLDLPSVFPPVIPDAEACDTEDNTYDDIFRNFFVDIESFDLMPHNYMTDFISGLEDCSCLPDYIDIG